MSAVTHLSEKLRLTLIELGSVKQDRDILQIKVNDLEAKLYDVKAKLRTAEKEYIEMDKEVSAQTDSSRHQRIKTLMEVVEQLHQHEHSHHNQRGENPHECPNCGPVLEIRGFFESLIEEYRHAAP